MQDYLPAFLHLPVRGSCSGRSVGIGGRFVTEIGIYDKIGDIDTSEDHLPIVILLRYIQNRIYNFEG